MEALLPDRSAGVLRSRFTDGRGRSIFSASLEFRVGCEADGEFGETLDRQVSADPVVLAGSALTATTRKPEFAAKPHECLLSGVRAIDRAEPSRP